MADKVVLITGITGQDGSYLAEHLLALGYEVHGTIRTTTSDIGTTRIARLVTGDEPLVTLHVTDLGDSHSLMRLIENVQPDEVYNLAAQSHVRHSFDQPVHTGDVTGLGAVRILEAIRHTEGDIRYYQASSSEMFGATPPPQNEDTPFHPRSPYAVAKVFAYWATVNYRESYGIHATNGILFNHESVPAETPVVVRRHGFVDIVPIGEIVPHRTDPRSGTAYTSDGGGWEVWDGERWVACTARSATWRDEEIRTVHGRGGVIEASDDHVVYTEDGEKPARDLRAGDRLVLADLPPPLPLTTMTEEEAWLLGILVAEGYVSPDGVARITCHDEAVLAEAASCWERVAAGTSVKVEVAPSGFGSGRRTPALNLNGNRAYLRMLRHELYTEACHKRIPKRILNASAHLQLVFMTAYNLGDGLTPPSAVLTAGFTWLTHTVLGRTVSTDEPEVRKVEARPHRGWLFDLATESGRFAAGPGLVVVHNSPRRGREFVTRKITSAIPRIIIGEQKKLRLGNLDARRDWGHARDYVEAMHLLVQHPEPLDLVIGTGESHTVREFLEVAFAVVDRDWQEHVEIDQALYRPAEAEHLQADPTSAREILGWTPKTSFAELVEEMVRADMAEHGLEA